MRIITLSSLATTETQNHDSRFIFKHWRRDFFLSVHRVRTRARSRSPVRPFVLYIILLLYYVILCEPTPYNNNNNATIRAYNMCSARFIRYSRTDVSRKKETKDTAIWARCSSLIFDDDRYRGRLSPVLWCSAAASLPPPLIHFFFL